MTKAEGPHVDPRLRDWATPTEARYLDALNETGSARAAAVACNVSHDVVRKAIKRLEARAALKGYSPDHAMTKPVPDGFMVKGVSTYYDKDGNTAGQWVKSTVDADRQAELFKAAMEAMAEDIPRLAPVSKPLLTNADLCNLYTITDYHAGMLAAKSETLDADWDLKIAEQTLVGCFEQMIAASPASRVGIVSQLGDFLHYDGLQAVTPSHGHLLDADGRYSKLVGAAIRMLRTVVDMALARHEVVHVVMAEGNHDMASSVWLRHMFAALYEKEPRVTVDTSALPYYVYQHGETMLAFHHGHLSKNAQLPLLFASQYPVMWGQTKKRYAHTGHRHHVEEKEHPGMKVVQHPTLAARDAYAARGGWISEREATAITYHNRTGKCGTVTVTPEMFS